MGKTKRSNRTRGGKTRKYLGGGNKSLIGQIIHFPVYVTKDGVLLGNPKVSTIKPEDNLDAVTPLQKYTINPTIQKYINNKMKDYNLSTFDKALNGAVNTDNNTNNNNLESAKQNAFKKLNQVIEDFKKESNRSNAPTLMGVYDGNPKFRRYLDPLTKLYYDIDKFNNTKVLTNLVENLNTLKLVTKVETNEQIFYNYGKENSPKGTIKTGDSDEINAFFKFLFTSPS